MDGGRADTAGVDDHDHETKADDHHDPSPVALNHHHHEPLHNHEFAHGADDHDHDRWWVHDDHERTVTDDLVNARHDHDRALTGVSRLP